MGLLTISSTAYGECSRTLIFASSGWDYREQQTSKDEEFPFDKLLFDGIMEIAGCTYERRFIPVIRLLNEIELGAIDGTTGASITVERAKYAHFTVPYRKEVIGLFMRKGELASFQPTQLADLVLSKLRVGVGSGSWYGAAFDRLKRNHPAFLERVLAHGNPEVKFKWLTRGRVDVVINDLHYGLSLLKTLGLKGQIEPHPFHINENNVHLMLSKKTVPAADLKILNDAIRKFHTTDRYQELLDLYQKF